MSDIKDILGVPRGGAPAEKQEKPKEQKLVKPKGMSREAFALLSSTHPLVPSQLMGELKKPEVKEKPKKRGQVTFQWQAFANPGRTDGLQLEHWVKCYKDAVSGAVAPADTEYPFAKYNKRPPVLRYNDDEWANLISPDPEWSRAETDYLVELAERLDLHWHVVADRWDFPEGQPRSVDDLKARYYSVARQLLLGREGGADAVANNILVKHPFSLQHERDRKRGLQLLFSRSPAQDAEEDIVLAEAAKIEAKRKAEAAKKAPAPTAPAAAAAPPPIQVSEFENEPLVSTAPLFNVAGEPALPAPSADAPAGTLAPRVIARVAHTKELVDAAMGRNLAEGELQTAAQKALQGSMAELKMADIPRGSSRAVCGAYLSLMREVAEHLELKRTLAARQALAGSKRVKREEGGTGDGDAEQRSEKRQRVAKRAFDG